MLPANEYFTKRRLERYFSEEKSNVEVLDRAFCASAGIVVPVRGIHCIGPVADSHRVAVLADRTVIFRSFGGKSGCTVRGRGNQRCRWHQRAQARTDYTRYQRRTNQGRESPKQLAFVDKVDFIIGPVNSGESLATVPIVAKAGIPNLIIGTIDELVDPQKFPLAFRAINTNKQWIEAANGYALNVLGKRKIAVIGDTSGYGTASSKLAQDLLDKAGVKPVYVALVDANKTDLTDELNKAKAAGAEVIMPWSAATG